MSHRETVQDHFPCQAPSAPATPIPELTVESPLRLDGRPGHERLALRGGEVVVSGDPPDGEQRRLALEQLEGFRLESLVGCCFVQARRDERWIDLLRLPGIPDQRLGDLIDRLDRCCRDRPGPELGGSPQGAAIAEAQGALPRSEVRGGPRPRLGALRQLYSLLRPFRARLLLLFLLSVGAAGIELAPPLLQKILVDRVLLANAPRQRAAELSLLLLAIVAGLLLIRLAAAAVTVIKGWMSSRVGTTLTANLRDALVRRFNELPLAFHDRQQVGALMSRAAYDTETLHTLVYHLTGGLLLQMLQLVGIGVAIVWLNPRLALVALLPMPFIIAGSWYFTCYLNPRHSHYWEAVGRQASALSGMLSGIRVVKSFAQEDRENARFRAVSWRLRDSRQTVDVSTSTFVAVLGLIFALGVLAAWYVGGRDVLLGGMTLGSLMAFLQYLAMFYSPLTSIGESTTWFSSFFTAMRRVDELMSASGEADGTSSSSPRPCVQPVKGELEFRKVSFGYARSRPVLQAVSFVARPGEMIGVVGRSGSGKSTMVSLVGRLYRPDAGSILLDGVDISQIPLQELRRSIGVVPQETFLFRGTVAENIGYGNPTLSPEELLRAALAADAHDFIMRLPLAYDTRLEESGAGLSGGERQRLSIARALAFDPVILILDEATSSVDVESEQAICRSLRRFARQRTSLIIAHRLSTLREADRLLVIDRGRLVEQGTHQELIAQGGLYRSLVSLQRTVKEGRRRQAATHRTEEASLTELGGDAALVESCSLDQTTATAGPGEWQRPDGNQPEWLEPRHTAIEDDGQGGLCLRLVGGAWCSAHAVYVFPALQQDRYLSLRGQGPGGREIELGMIRDLASWPEPVQQRIRRSLGRRYLLRQIREVQQIRPRGLGVTVQVSSDSGNLQLLLEKPAQAVRPFGQSGLLLTDEAGRHYLIPDRAKLPRRQRRLLALYFGH